MSASAEPDWADHCCDMWRRHVLAQTGFDIETITGPSPRSARHAAAIMRRLGVRSLSGLVSFVHGPALASSRLARRGDIVRAGWALGVCCGEQALFYNGQTASMRAMEEAWSVTRICR